MISFNKFIVAASLATLVSLTAGWASAQSSPPPVQSFEQAQEDVRNAPTFCAVTYIMRDQTRGWVAVCELDTAE